MAILAGYQSSSRYGHGHSYFKNYNECARRECATGMEIPRLENIYLVCDRSTFVTAEEIIKHVELYRVTQKSKQI